MNSKYKKPSAAPATPFESIIISLNDIKYKEKMYAWYQKIGLDELSSDSLRETATNILQELKDEVKVSKWTERNKILQAR